MMRSLFFIILVGYAVKCDDSSYYVVEVPAESTRVHKPFKVYWNVPTMQCRSKRIPFTKLFEKYGIIQNTNDSFRGEKIAILYDPGLFPALFKSENGSFKFRNGGVPQEGDLEKHLDAFRETMEQSIPDTEFDGVGIIDFESWRPVFRQNFGVLTPYKDISYQIERQLHWFWPEKAIQSRARSRFEEAARRFMQGTLALARALRPRALWGYYAFPYCFNMSPNNALEACASGVPRENDNISWLWSGSSALYPSVYTAPAPNSRLASLAALVRGRVREAARVRPAGVPILPYFWYRHRDGSYLSQDELNTVLATLYSSQASGFIVWGSSNDVNTVEKCKKLYKYTEELLGPSISKYTKRVGNLDTTTNPVGAATTLKTLPVDNTSNRDQVTGTRQGTDNKTTDDSDVNIENSWKISDDITEDMLHSIQNKQNESKYSIEQEYLNMQKKTFLEMLFNMITNERETENEYLINSEKQTDNKSETEEPTEPTIHITSTNISNFSDSNLELISEDTDKTTTNIPEQITEADENKYKSNDEVFTNETDISVQEMSPSSTLINPMINNTSNILKSNEKLSNNSNFFFLFNDNVIDKSFEGTNYSTPSLLAVNVSENYTQSEVSNSLLNESSPSFSSDTINWDVEDTITTTSDPIDLIFTDFLVTNTDSAQIKDDYELTSTTDSYHVGDTKQTDEYLYEDSNVQNLETSTQPNTEASTGLVSKSWNSLGENNEDGNFYSDILSLALNITEFLSSGFTNIQEGDKILRLDEEDAETSGNTYNTTYPNINVPDESNEKKSVTDETSTNSASQVVTLV